jgi:hypothetical protein
MPKESKKLAVRYILEEIMLLDKEINTDTSSIDFSDLEKFNYHLSAETSLNGPDKILSISIFYTFFSESTMLFRFNVVNKFKIFENSEKELTLIHSNERFMKHLISISIDHSRGIQSILIKETPFKSLYIPLRYNLKINRQKSEELNRNI